VVISYPVAFAKRNIAYNTVSGGFVIWQVSEGLFPIPLTASGFASLSTFPALYTSNDCSGQGYFPINVPVDPAQQLVNFLSVIVSTTLYYVATAPQTITFNSIGDV